MRHLNAFTAATLCAAFVALPGGSLRAASERAPAERTPTDRATSERAAQAAAPDLDAVVVYESRQTLANGVTRTETWRERLVRRGDNVWIERIVARAQREHAPLHPHPHAHAHVTHATHAEPAHKKHFNYETAARWLVRGADGSVQLRFVDPQRTMIVDVPRTEFATVGFDGRWDAYAHIVPPSAFGAMQPAPVGTTQGASGGTTVRVSRSEGGWSHRVVWSSARQIALRVESVRADGAARRTVTVEPTAPAGTVPWRGLEGLEKKTYDDFLD